jgi:hypothetical protein
MPLPRAAPPCAVARAHAALRWPAKLGRARCAGRGRTGPRARVAMGCICVVHVGRADAVSVGHAPLCNWAKREFGPVTLDLVFLIFEYIQILADLKICVRFI